MAKSLGMIGVMRLEQVLAELEARRDTRAIAVWQRLGMDIRAYFGVNLTQLKQLASNIGRQHNLAIQLWETGIHDARLLAVLIEEPEKMTEAQLDQWMSEVDYWDLSDKIAQLLVPKLEPKLVGRKVKQWLKSSNEWIERAAYILIGQVAKLEKDVLPAKDFEVYLKRVERQIRKAKNWVQEGMLYAVMAIGTRNKTLYKKALAVASRIKEFEIEVDYGDTSCRTPDVLAYLESEKVQAKMK